MTGRLGESCYYFSSAFPLNSSFKESSPVPAPACHLQLALKADCLANEIFDFFWIRYNLCATYQRSFGTFPKPFLDLFIENVNKVLALNLPVRSCHVLHQSRRLCSFSRSAKRYKHCAKRNLSGVACFRERLGQSARESLRV